MYRAGPMQAPASGGRNVFLLAGSTGPVAAHASRRVHATLCIAESEIHLPEALVRAADLRDSAEGAARACPVGNGGHLTHGEGNA